MAAAAPLGHDLKRRAAATLILVLITTGVFSLALLQQAAAATQVMIVEGLGGDDDYARQFAEQVDRVLQATRSLVPTPTMRVFRVAEARREAVLEHLAALSGSLSEDDLLLIYLIGHGSYDELEYKFNIAGPDLTDADILDALEKLPARRQVIVNTSSASGAAADRWQSDSRIVISATRSGSERHATRFGAYFATALADTAADLDKNDLVTAQEAFDFAERGVKDFFDSAGRLATEHARLSGQDADRVTLARLSAARPASGDALLARLTAARDEIAGRADQLRLARSAMAAEEYQQQLLAVMLELAEAEEAIEARERELQQP